MPIGFSVTWPILLAIALNGYIGQRLGGGKSRLYISCRMTVKNVQVTGEAASTYGGAAPGTKRRSRKQGGGGSTSPGTITQLRANHVPGIPVMPVVGVDSALTQAAAPTTGGGSVPAVIGGALVKREQTPGPAVKVVLEAPKKKPVVLQPKAVPAQRKTRRASRSIRVSVSGLGKRLHRATTIRKDAGSLDLAEIKKMLQKAALIKADTKAPESILRQMYADYMMLKDRAL